MEGEKEFLSNIEKLKADVLACCRNPEHPPRILPVSKTQPIERILPLKQAGFTAIGENHAQEILEKFPALGADFEIHMIGRLQTNKIKYIINRVCLVQSLDSIHLAQALDARAQACGIVMPVLVQLNTGREAQKGGLPPEEIVAFASTEDIDPTMLTDFISEYEFSGTMDAGNIRDRINKPMPLLKKRSLVNRIVDFIRQHTEKFQ